MGFKLSGRKTRKQQDKKHEQDWMYYSSSDRKFKFKLFKKLWKQESIFTPHMFEGDPTGVEKFVRSKHPDVPQSLIFYLERLVVNPTSCVCCDGDDDTPNQIAVKEYMKFQGE